MRGVVPAVANCISARCRFPFEIMNALRIALLAALGAITAASARARDDDIEGKLVHTPAAAEEG